MNKFYNVTDSIYRLKVPFEAIYTSVFLIKSPSGAILVDCATTSEDVDQCIVPALVEMGYELSDIETLVLTHNHGGQRFTYEPEGQPSGSCFSTRTLAKAWVLWYSDAYTKNNCPWREVI